jgi:hypothetical protein
MIKLFNTVKRESREFGYKPLFYDADQEELEARIKARENREVTSTESMKHRMRSEFGRQRRSQVMEQKNYSKRSSLRLLLIIIALSVLSYIVLERWLPDLIHAWFPLEHQEYELLDPYDS